MKLKVFIERPVLSIVISVAIVLIGCISLFTLPIEQFPSIRRRADVHRRTDGAPGDRVGLYYVQRELPAVPRGGGCCQVPACRDNRRRGTLYLGWLLQRTVCVEL